MDNRERGVMDLIREDSILNKKVSYEEFYNQNVASPTNQDDPIKEAFQTYIETCEKLEK